MCVAAGNRALAQCAVSRRGGRQSCVVNGNKMSHSVGERVRKIQMINYEEELKKFHPSMDVNEAEDAIYSRDLTDVTDILKEMMKDEKKNRKQGIS